jgi:two-component system, LytTR family, response regulator
MNNKYQAIIIDDELPARLMIKDLLKKHAREIQIIGEAKTGSEAIDLIDENPPDILFLDIQLPDFNGFELLSKLKTQPIVIFTTAYDQYALEAFSENSLDYLVKPIEQHRFDQAIEKLKSFNKNAQKIDVEALLSSFNRQKKEKVVTALPIKLGHKIVLVRFSDIVYCKSGDGYVSVYTKSGKEYLSELKLHQLENKLPGNFLRVQKSYIINVDMILEIHRYFNNRYIIAMNGPGNPKITTGTSYAQIIRRYLDL